MAGLKVPMLGKYCLRVYESSLIILCRYRPRDLISKQLKNRMGLVRSSGGGERELVEDFKDIRSKFKPIMRHFFTERHKVPLRWFEMRLRYSRSVATTSIIGYILGLGDRHTSNILIDTHTGEVVHIDLGIAFDQVRSFQSHMFV